MRVKSTRQKVDEVYIKCAICDFNKCEDLSGLPLRLRGDIVNNLRAAARRHVAKTGHGVEVEITKYSVYKPESEGE